MALAVKNQQAEDEALVARALAQAQFEIERVKRDAATREAAPWKDDAWDGEGKPPTAQDDIDSDIEW